MCVSSLYVCVGARACVSVRSLASVYEWMQRWLDGWTGNFKYD